jgi:hypothetical protein
VRGARALSLQLELGAQAPRRPRAARLHPSGKSREIRAPVTHVDLLRGAVQFYQPLVLADRDLDPRLLLMAVGARTPKRRVGSPQG